jgi:aminomethyltransferase
MRVSALHPQLASHGATFKERFGVEIPVAFNDIGSEYQLIRNAVGVSDFSFMQKYRIPEEKALDFLDSLFAGNVARLRYGRVLHTFLANEQGELVADCYIANNDQEFILLCESLADDATLNAILREHGAVAAGLEDLTENHTLISIDGFKAWSVVKEIFGADVLGLPYLSIEIYPFGSGLVRLLRCGKTSEFGYLLMAPREMSESLLEKIMTAAAGPGGGMCGLKVHNELRLEGRFFNIFAEGSRVKNPLELGLQWMIDFEKERFSGSVAILAQRAAGVNRKIIGVRAEATTVDFVPGALVYDDTDKVGTVEAVCFSYVLNARIGLIMLPTQIAYSGLSFRLGSKNGVELKTISMPPIMPKSLTVKLDEV